MAESIKRNITTAAREVLLTEKEKAEIKDAAARRAKEQVKQDEIRELEREAYRQEQERLTKSKAEAEKQRQIKNWQFEKGIAQELQLLFGTDLKISIWERSAGVDKRIYLKKGDYFKGKEIATLYVSGNAKIPPMKMVQESYFQRCTIDGAEDVVAKTKEVLKKVSEYYKHGKIDCNEALDFELPA